jgi:predicted phosphodiesterase
MKRRRGLKSEIAREYVEKHSSGNKLRLAKLIYAENKEVYKNVEDARRSVRYVTGAVGGKSRKYVPDSEVKINKQFSWNKIPEGEKQLDWDSPVIVKGRKVLVLSDIHVPFQDKDALILALEYGKKVGIDALYLNGDIMDAYQISRFLRDPRQKNFKEELMITRELLKTFREYFGDKVEIYYKVGNHDFRYDQYMRSKAPELYGIMEFSLENMLNLKSLNIHFVKNKEWAKIGNLIVAHGHEAGRGFTNPVSASRGIFLKSVQTILIGHYHQPSSYTNNTWDGSPITTWSTGCLCDLHPEYAPKNNWSHGFCTVELVGADGAFVVENKKIWNGRIVPV